MSDQLQDGLRFLRNEEDSVIRALLGHVKHGDELLQELDGARVSDMDDGGMGSIKFAGDERRCLGICLVEGEFVDSDGATVSIVLNADDNGRLYELDMWKANFAPLRDYPTCERMAVKP